MSKKEEIDKLVKVEPTANISLLDYNTTAEASALANHLIMTKSLPGCWFTVERVMLGLQTAKELGLPPTTALSNMLHFFEGRVVLGVHGIAALLKKNGVYVKVEEDFAYVKKDGSVDKTRLPDVEYIDKRTTIVGIQYIKNSDGTIFDKIETKISYSWKEAINQGLTTKENWQKMPIIMLRTRALTLLGRFLGVISHYEIAEVADFTNKEVTIDTEGEVIISKK